MSSGTEPEDAASLITRYAGHSVLLSFTHEERRTVTIITSTRRNRLPEYLTIASMAPAQAVRPAPAR